jgi:NAD+ kinase
MKSALCPKRIGFVVKHHQREAYTLARSLAHELIERKVKIFFSDESKELALKVKKESSRPSNVQILPKIELITHTDLILVLGGDGTYLSIARLMKKKSVPVLGINAGRLGFLTEIKQTEAHEVVRKIIAGKPIPISKRLLLDVTVTRNRKIIFQGPVVNDAVIAKGAIARIISIEVTIDGKFVNQVRADGLIVATPTGSTAYSLAAGGPIVEPSVPAVLLTPICPHSLTQRSLVVHENAEIQMRIMEQPGSVLLTLDGQEFVELKKEDEIRVRSFKQHRLHLVSSPNRDYYGLIREKLQFGGGYVGNA